MISFRELGPPAAGTAPPVPLHLVASYLEGDGGGGVSVAMEWGAGELAVTRFEVFGSRDAPLTAKNFRAVRFQEVIDRIKASASMALQHEASGIRSMGAADLERLEGAVSQRRRLTPHLLAQVANIARANPDQPTKQVADQLYTSHRNATRWIAEAKRQGLLKEQP